MISFFYNGAPIAWEFFVTSCGVSLAFFIFIAIILLFILFQIFVPMYSIYLMYKMLKKKLKNHINDDFYYILGLYGSVLGYGIIIILLQAIPFIGFFVSILVLLFTLKIRDMLKNI